MWSRPPIAYKKQEQLTLREHGIWVGSVVLVFLHLCFVLLCVFTFWVPCCNVPSDIRIPMIVIRITCSHLLCGVVRLLRRILTLTTLNQVWFFFQSAVILCPNELEDTQKTASYLGLHIEIDNGGRLRTTSLFISNISQRIRYSRAFVLYSDFLDRAQLLTQRLLQEGYVTPGSSLALWNVTDEKGRCS
jgi:hypothetical protein